MLLGKLWQLGTQTQPRSDHPGSQRWLPKVDLAEQGGGDPQQRSKQPRLVSLVWLAPLAYPVAMRVRGRLPERTTGHP